VASDEGVDEYGMNEVHLKVLKALSNGPLASKRIPTVTGRKEEEVEKYIMPYLLCITEDQPAMVTTCSKGYVLTDDGRNELLKRNLSYKGLRAV
jgi:Holliday junction resolvasome RuvABC ATP-dependent DNA helicase subunit